MLALWLRQKTIENRLVKQQPWIEKADLTYQFSHSFTLTVKEQAIVGYQLAKQMYRPVLADGRIVDEEAVPESETAMIIELTKEEDVKSFIKQLGSLDETVRRSIRRVKQLNSAGGQHLLLLEMLDGHQVRVPLPRLKERMAYYHQISQFLLEPSIIDMEVGIYATTEMLEAPPQDTKESDSQEPDTSVPTEAIEETSEEVPLSEEAGQEADNPSLPAEG